MSFLIKTVFLGYSELGYISSNFREISCEYNWVLSAKCGYQENKILPCEYQNFFLPCRYPKKKILPCEYQNFFRFAVSISEKIGFAVWISEKKILPCEYQIFLIWITRISPILRVNIKNTHTLTTTRVGASPHTRGGSRVCILWYSHAKLAILC